MNCSIFLNKYLYHKNFYYLNDSKRRFSVSNVKLSNIDKILSDLAKHQEEMQKFKRQLDEEKEKTFAAQAEDKLDELMNKHAKVEDKMIDHMIEGFSILGEKKSREIRAQFSESKEKIVENVEKRAIDLEDEFKDEIKSVAYFQKKVDIEAARFKNVTQLSEKEEKEIDKEIKKKEDYSEFKEEYERERSEWIKEHKLNVHSCRQEKKNLKDDLGSNLEKASEMAENLTQETGPDYTGGDD